MATEVVHTALVPGNRAVIAFFKTESKTTKQNIYSAASVPMPLTHPAYWRQFQSVWIVFNDLTEELAIDTSARQKKFLTEIESNPELLKG